MKAALGWGETNEVKTPFVSVPKIPSTFYPIFFYRKHAICFTPAETIAAVPMITFITQSSSVGFRVLQR